MKLLSRFHEAQSHSYDQALAEIKGGRKRTHWIWFIFPQIEGLGYSSTAQYYGIQGLAEARAYLADPILGARLIEITKALLALKSTSASVVFGYPDDLKVRSCMTLFSIADSGNPLFQAVLDRFYGGVADQRTVELLG